MMQTRRSAPIGVFDSGVGGLTVVRELQKVLPHEDIVFCGDTARAPYGSRSLAEILEFCRQHVRFLTEKKVKIAVIACNTMTANGYLTVREETGLPLIPMDKAVKTAAAKAPGKTIGVISTMATAQSRMHAMAARELGIEEEVYACGCPLLTPLVEKGVIHGPEIQAALAESLQPFAGKNIGTLILGCTHYPLLAAELEKMLPEVVIVDPAAETSRAAAAYLAAHDLLNQKKEPGFLQCYFSGDMQMAKKMTVTAVGECQTEFCQVDLAKY